MFEAIQGLLLLLRVFASSVNVQRSCDGDGMTQEKKKMKKKAVRTSLEFVEFSTQRKKYGIQNNVCTHKTEFRWNEQNEEAKHIKTEFHESLLSQKQWQNAMNEWAKDDTQ